MTNNPEIKNIDDLHLEKQRLKANIKIHKENIGLNVDAIKDEINPFTGISKVTKNIFSLSASKPVLSFGVSTLADFLLKKTFLKRAGILSRIFLPIIVKTVSEIIVPQENKKSEDRSSKLLGKHGDPHSYQATTDKFKNSVATKLHLLAGKIRS
jgi:hypothetical protein